MPSITAVRILSEFSTAGFFVNVSCRVQIQRLRLSQIISYQYQSLYLSLHTLYVFLYLSLSHSLRLISALVSLNCGFLWPKAVSKLPRVVLWLHRMNRGPAGWRDRSRQRSGLLGILMCGIGWFVNWLLTHLRERSVGFWLALCTLTDVAGPIVTLSGVQTGAGNLLFSHWVAVLSKMKPSTQLLLSLVYGFFVFFLNYLCKAFRSGSHCWVSEISQK